MNEIRPVEHCVGFSVRMPVSDAERVVRAFPESFGIRIERESTQGTWERPSCGRAYVRAVDADLRS